MTVKREESHEFEPNVEWGRDRKWWVTSRGPERHRSVVQSHEGGQTGGRCHEISCSLVPSRSTVLSKGSNSHLRFQDTVPGS